MSNFIVEQSVIGVLNSHELPQEVGGGPNPFNELVGYLDKTRGPWHHQNEVKGGKQKFLSELSSQFAPAPSSGLILYRSPYFDPQMMEMSVIPQAFGLFAALGMYFDLVNFSAFVAIDDDIYDNPVPEYMPNSMTQGMDEDGNQVEPVPVTWEEWKDATHDHLKIDKMNYIPLNSNTKSNNCCGSIVSKLIGDGFNVDQMAMYPKQDAPELEV